MRKAETKVNLHTLERIDTLSHTVPHETMAALEEYIASSIALHLSATLTDPASQAELAKFLSSASSSANPSSAARLFVWITPDDPLSALASTTALPQNSGSLVFLPATATSLQCLLLAPKSEGESDPFAHLQSLTRLFLPALSSSATNLSGLQEKLHELDVVLGQCRRMALTSVPLVHLKCHPQIVSAAPDWDGKETIDSSPLPLEEDAFLNAVQSTVNAWITQIRSVTNLLSTPFPSVAAQADLEEISFWNGLYSSLQHIRDELSKKEALFTIALLKYAKRFVSTLALENNTNLDEALSVTEDVLGFLKEYPAPELAACRDWNKMLAALRDWFGYLPKIRTCRCYDLDRLAKLVEATTGTFRGGMENILRDGYGGNGVIFLEYDRYEREVRGPTQDVFVEFDAEWGTFREFFLEQGRMRRRAEGNHVGDDGNKVRDTPAQVFSGITLHHQVLRERLDAIHQFRTEHEKLKNVMKEVLTGETEGEEEKEYSTWALREVEDAPMALFASVDVLDLSEKGEVAFGIALEGYDRNVDGIEERLAKLLRDKLANCQVSLFVYCVHSSTLLSCVYLNMLTTLT